MVDLSASAPRSLRRHKLPTVMDSLIDVIVAAGHAPGDKLPTELEFASTIGVSRGVIREALRSMQSLGMVEIRHGHGIYLAEASLANIAVGLEFWSRLFHSDPSSDHVVRGVSEVRAMLEIGVLESLGMQLSALDIDDMQGCVDAMSERARRGEAHPAADRHFHEVLYRPVDNWILRGLLSELWDCTDRLAQRHPPKVALQTIVLDHQRVVDALRTADLDAAVAALRAHFAPFTPA